MTPDQIDSWTRTVAHSGGLVAVSDDLALLGAAERAVLDDVLAINAAADHRSRTVAPPTCPDLLGRDGPTRLRGPDDELVLDLVDGRSVVLDRATIPS